MFFAAALMLFAAASAVMGEEAGFSISIDPGLSVPVGQNAQYFAPGGGFDILGEYRLAGLAPLRIVGSLGYTLLPIKTATTISLLSAGAGLGVGWEPTPNLVLSGSLQAGFFYGFFNDPQATAAVSNPANGGGNPFVAGSMAGTCMFNRSFGAGLGVGYRQLFGFVGDLRVFAMGMYRFPPPGAAKENVTWEE
jgi:hypothetical protein